MLYWLSEAWWCTYRQFVIIGLGIGLLPIQCQAITQANDDLLSVHPFRTNFLQILIEIQ